jgi:hypothetical protein
LDIKTGSLSLSDLSSRLGIEPSPGSFDKGTPRLWGRKKGTPLEHTLLRFESAAPEPAPLTEHFQSIFSSVSIDLLRMFTKATDDWEIWFTIGMMFPVEEMPYPELTIPPECVQMLNGNGIGIDITLYPGRAVPQEVSDKGEDKEAP